MKKTCLFALLSLIVTTVNAQIPPVSSPACASCGGKGSHKSGCIYSSDYNNEEYSYPKEKKLKDVTPLPELEDMAQWQKLYFYYGHSDERCPECDLFTHKNGCKIAKLQKKALNYREKAAAATSIEKRNKALKDFRSQLDKLISLCNSWKSKREEAERKANEQAQHNTPQASYGGSQHLSSVDIKNTYDKKFALSSGAAAYGKTSPNGEEEWTLFNSSGKEVGRFSKVETVQLSRGWDTEDVFLVRDFNGKWGIGNATGDIVSEPQYESLKAHVTIRQNGQQQTFFDATKRYHHGMIRHGILDSGGAQLIPCMCERVELLDRSPEAHGQLAILSIEGIKAVYDVEKGRVLLQPAAVYVNTYFTRKGMYFIVGDGTSFGAYYAGTDEPQEVVSPSSGKTFDQVRNLIDDLDR